VDRLIYREGEIPLGQVKKGHEQGSIYICPICGSELIVAFSEDEVANSKYGKGIFCPVDLAHIHVRVMARRSKLSF
jgi:predicted RNA-binding Zn-ribbon protein involved in translation (DUF1610 family)